MTRHKTAGSSPSRSPREIAHDRNVVAEQAAAADPKGFERTALLPETVDFLQSVGEAPELAAALDAAEYLERLLGLSEDMRMQVQWFLRDEGGIEQVSELGVVLSQLLGPVPVDADGLSARAWVAERMGQPVTRRHVVTVTDRSERIRTVRQPAVVSLALLPPLEAVAVDGEPMVSTIAGGAVAKRRYRRRTGVLPFPSGPLTLGDVPVQDAIVEAVASLPLTGDERSPLRGDTLRMAAFGYAASGPLKMDYANAARLYGADTPANRIRVRNAAAVFDSLSITLDNGGWINLGIAKSDGDRLYLARPPWWTGEGKMAAWRLTGELFRTGRGRRGAGGAEVMDAALWRTLAGLESLLGWSPSAGRGRHGRLPDAVQPMRRPGGPGPLRFVPWRGVLALAGEPVPPNAGPGSKWGRTYRRRVDALVKWGYRVPPRGGAAPAGDTVEIVEVLTGRGRSGVAGLRVRATARLCAAYADQVYTRLPAARVLGIEGGNERG